MSASGGMGLRVGRAMAQMTAVRLVNLATMAVGLVVLTRLLTPAEFGTFAIGLALYGVATILGELGLRDYVIRLEADPAPGLVAAGALVSLSVSVGLAAAFVLVPPLLPAGWLPEGLSPTLVPLALALLVPPFLLRREARLHRGIDFAAPAKAQLAHVLPDVLVAILLAHAGFGALALSCGLLAGQLGRAATLLLLSRPEPRARPAFGDVAPMIRFGAALAWVRVLPVAVDMVLVATLAGASGIATAGYFNRAKRMRDLLKDVLLLGMKPVVLPAFGAALREGMAPRDMILESRRRFAPVALPAFLGIALLADPLVRLLFGPTWEATIPAVRVLALGAAVAPVTLLAQNSFTALDRVNAFGRIQMIVLSFRLLGGIAMAFVSLVAFCAVLALGRWLKAVLILNWERRELGIGAREQAVLLRETALVTMASLAGPVALAYGTDWSPAVVLSGSVMTGTAGWIAAMRWTANPLWRETLGVIRDAGRSA